jgi:hypothetical protein
MQQKQTPVTPAPEINIDILVNDFLLLVPGINCDETLLYTRFYSLPFSFDIHSQAFSRGIITLITGNTPLNIYFKMLSSFPVTENPTYFQSLHQCNSLPMC